MHENLPLVATSSRVRNEAKTVPLTLLLSTAVYTAGMLVSQSATLWIKVISSQQKLYICLGYLPLGLKAPRGITIMLASGWAGSRRARFQL